MDLRKLKRIISIFLACLVLGTALLPTAYAVVPAKVSSSSAKAYQKASTKAKGVKVPKNLKVSITAFAGNWAKVSYDGNSAYMKVKALMPTAKVKGYTKATTTVYNSSGKKQGTLSKGAAIYVLGTIGGYYCVMNGSGAIGYVKSGTLTDKKPEITNVKPTVVLSKIDKALLLAKSLLGRRYSMSGSPPNCFNCSSFVQYCMGAVGYPMKNTALSQSQDSRYARISSIGSLKKGDILFFDTTGDGKVDHSAIYISGNTFVEASRNAGKVQVNTLTSWYRSHFKCARRPA